MRTLDLVAGAVLCLLAALPVAPVFGGLAWAAVLLAGLLVGSLVVLLARGLGWPPAATVGALLAAYMVTACAVVASTLPVVATLESVLGPVVLGSPAAWRSLVVAAPPVGGLDGLLVVPLQVGVLAGALVAVGAGRRAPWPVAVPPLVLVGAILLGPDSTLLPVLVGGSLALGSTAWAAVRRSWTLTAPATPVPSSPAPGGASGTGRRVVASAGVLVLASAVTVAAVGSGTVSEPVERFVLRDVIVPPVDVTALPSPLAGFRAWSKTQADDVLLTVTGLPSGTPVRLAALDSYDGVTWNVSDAVAGSGSPGRFDRVGSEVGPDDLALPAQVPAPEVADVSIEVGDYVGVWLPAPGYLRTVEIASERGRQVRSSLVYNSATGTGVVGEGLRTGDVVRATVLLPQVTDGVEGAAVAQASQPEPQAVPDLVAVLAGDLAADAVDPWSQAGALSDGLAGTGYYSDGSAEASPSRAGHGSDRLVQFLSAPVLVGDDEQYAATMALMARSLGLPSRVVVGFVPGDEETQTVQVLGSDVTAWTEVAFDGHGWVPFFPTPDEQRVPPEEGTRPQQQERPQVQPPVPPLEDVEQPAPVTADEVDDAADDEEEPGGNPLVLVVLVAAAVGGLLLLLLPVVAVLLAKAVRRARRRRRGPAAVRAAAGWDEAVDVAVDLGADRPVRATRREAAKLLPLDGPATALAERADTAVFAAAEPTEADVSALWSEVDALVGTWSRQVPLRRRVRARLSVRSLRRR